MARPRKSDPKVRDWPRIRTLLGRNGVSTFQVDSLRDLTPRVRKNFKTMDDALAYAQLLRSSRNQNGLASLGLTPAQMDDARAALVILREAGIGSLVEAARIATRHHRPSGGDITLQQLRERFLEFKLRKGRRDRTMRDLESRTSTFIQTFSESQQGSKAVAALPLVKDVTASEVQQWFDDRGFTKQSAQTALNYRRVLSNMFSYAVKQRYCASNPVSGVELPEVDGALPQILTVSQCRALLETARVRYPDFVPYITLGLFCGLRPDSELGRLSWDDIQLDRARVHVPRHKTKVSLARNVTLPQVAIEWLMLSSRREGPIMPPRFRQRWDRLRWYAGFDTLLRPTVSEHSMLKPGGAFEGRILVRWPGDVMRHTFATNHLAHHRNVALTSAEMGHLRASTLVHYSGLEPKTDPAAFWNLRPAIGSNFESIASAS